MSQAAATAQIAAAEARAIAKEAFIYGFPMVDGYRIQHAYFVDRDGPEFKVPFNQIANFARVFTPEDTVVQTPNSDTPYSFAGLDLRAEPIVLTTPPVEAGRYFSVQLIDLYTFNFDYLGSRATSNNGGSFMVAGPDWKGPVPAGVTKVIRAETELVCAIYRTQLFNPEDIENVKSVQAGYRVEGLSSFLGQPPPEPAPPIDFIEPLAPGADKTSLDFFNVLNFLLQFCPTDPSETALMARFGEIGIGPGMTLDIGSLSPGVRDALQAGIGDAWSAFEYFRAKEFATGKVTSGDVFGSRETLKNNYLYRMAAAALGIYGNSAKEAMYPAYAMDGDGAPLTGSHNYTLHFAKGQLPPVNAFWSLTMYQMPSSLLVANPLNRYLLNSPMLPQFTLDDDGGLTLIIQTESPGPDREANWLPAPKGAFSIFMRLYWPTAEALAGQWEQPPILRVG